MAAALAEPRMATAGIDAVIASAGTLGINGQRAPQEAQDAMQEVGLSLEGHRSQGISSMLLRSATHIVVMTPLHAAEILRRDPNVEGKIRRLWEYGGTPDLVEIEDPVGGTLEDFRACRAILERCLDGFIRTL